MLILSIALPAPAATDAPKSKTSLPTKQLGASKAGPRFEIGVGYARWNERLSLTQGPNSTDGAGSYTGFIITTGATERWGHWLGELQFSLGKGSAVSGGFSSSINFADGFNRNWFAVFIKPSFRYLLNPYFSIGPGVLVRLRAVDWSPADASILVQSTKPVSYGPSLDMQLKLVPHWALAQSFATMGSTNEVQWTSTAIYIF